MHNGLIAPRFLSPGDTIGIFTPSDPGYKGNPELFENGLRNIEKLGFRVKLGSLTTNRASDGYRSASGKERAAELMGLVLDPEVRGVMSTIGGYNSNSLIPYLDFEAIQKSRKVFCGYSDVTSLHLAILHYSKLRTFYGPSVMCWFGEWPNGIEESSIWFLDAVQKHTEGARIIDEPKRFSRHRRSWSNGDWKNIPRQWIPNDGWKVLAQGKVEAPIFAFNLNTLMSAAGTPYWPDLRGCVLLVEEMDAPLMKEERLFRQLELMGVFKEISGLIIGKPEIEDSQGASFNFEDLLFEILGRGPAFPVITNFDCGHTIPMLTVPQGCRVRLTADLKSGASLEFLEPSCSP
jgi:muramoyltetrapeptide carboxypeptidase